MQKPIFRFYAFYPATHVILVCGTELPLTEVPAGVQLFMTKAPVSYFSRDIVLSKPVLISEHYVTDSFLNQLGSISQ